LISEKDLQRIENRQKVVQPPVRASIPMDEEKEADYDEYCNMIEKVLGRNNSQQDDGEEETKYGSDAYYMPSSGMSGEDQDASN
jgi:hypothetical protein